ncbi:MAG: hypothetical protein LLF28_06100 [Nitrospiraceae bacterium]|nr:hypothetical protein [Nitrospiraceae bacterium]
MSIFNIFKRKKTIGVFTSIAIAVFSVISILHLIRFIFCWEITVNSINIPVWLSALGFIIAGGLAFMLWKEGRR